MLQINVGACVHRVGMVDPCAANNGYGTRCTDM